MILWARWLASGRPAVHAEAVQHEASSHFLQTWPNALDQVTRSSSVCKAQLETKFQTSHAGAITSTLTMAQLHPERQLSKSSQ